MWVKKVSNTSQGSVATWLRCGGIFNGDFITNFLRSVTVKDFCKSIGIWQLYGQGYSGIGFNYSDRQLCFLNQPVLSNIAI